MSKLFYRLFFIFFLAFFSANIFAKPVSGDAIIFDRIEVDVSLIFPGQYKTYDKNGNVIGNVTFDNITPVILKSRSGKRMHLKNSKDDCAWAYYVTFSYQGKDVTMFGSDVFATTKTLPFIYHKQPMKLLTVKNFSQGASNEDGLTGCEEFQYLFIEQNGTYTPVQTPTNTGDRDVKRRLAMLLQDDQADEEIQKISVIKDKLKITIKATYQESDEIYDLDVALAKKPYQSLKISYKGRK